MNVNTFLQSVNVADGFSWDCLHDTIPATGFAVSAFKNRERIFDHVPSAMEIASFILENADVLFSTKYILGAHSKVLGCWHYEGKYYLDVSLIYSNRTTALQTGFLNDQIAIWDIENGCEILCSEVADTFKVYA